MITKYISSALLLIAVFAAQTAIAQPSSVAEVGASVYSSSLGLIKPYIVPAKGVVAKVSNATVYIANESGFTLNRGTILDIVHTGEPILHPATGEKIGEMMESAGKVRVIDSDDKMITAVALSASTGIKPGDSIVAEQSGVARVALFMDMALEVIQPDDLSADLYRRISRWDDVVWVSRSAMARFSQDEKIVGEQSLANSETFEKIKSRLNADQIIFLHIKQLDNSFATDVSLYNLDNPRYPVTSFGNMVADQVASPPVVDDPPVQPPVTKTGAEPTTEPVVIKQGLKSKTVKSFKKEIAAMVAHDLDNDGAREIIVGFNNSVAIFKLTDIGLSQVWEKKLGSRSQIIGISAGDFNGNGKVEVYVNATTSSRTRSFVFERDGKGYSVVLDQQGLMFFAGDDGKLYARGQKNDFRPDEKIVNLRWQGQALESSPFMTLPKSSGMTGVHFTDLDGDGVTDIAGYLKNHSLTYYGSSDKQWHQLAGTYGGSNIKTELFIDDETDHYHEHLPALLIEHSASGAHNIIAVRNISSAGFVPNPSYSKAQVVVLQFDGTTFAEKIVTPVTKGVITGMTHLTPSTFNHILVSKNYTALMGEGTSELMMIDLEKY